MRVILLLFLSVVQYSQRSVNQSSPGSCSSSFPHSVDAKAIREHGRLFFFWKLEMTLTLTFQTSIEVKNRLSSTSAHDKLLSSTRLLPPFLTDKVRFQSPTRKKEKLATPTNFPWKSFISTLFASL
jgi:hypothetical protein